MPRALFTIATRDFLPQSMLLLNSAKKESSLDLNYYLFTVDGENENWPDLPEWIKVVHLGELSIPNIEQRKFFYRPHEFVFSLKPVAFLHLLQLGYEELVYCDADIKFYSGADIIYEKLAEYELLLTPHIVRPFLAKDKHPTLQQLVNSGVYNMGFVALKKSQETLSALQWWNEVLSTSCLDQYGWGIFVDQSWATLLPSFVSSSKVLRDERFNMAWWNLHQRTLTLEKGGYQTRDGSLVFFHFSHLPKLESESKSNELASDQNWSSINQNSATKSLVEEYREELSNYKSSYPDGTYQYPYASYSDGSLIEISERSYYLNLSPAQRDKLGNPFNARIRIRRAIRVEKNKKLQQGIAKTIKSFFKPSTR